MLLYCISSCQCRSLPSCLVRPVVATCTEVLGLGTEQGTQSDWRAVHEVGPSYKLGQGLNFIYHHLSHAFLWLFACRLSTGTLTRG